MFSLSSRVLLLEGKQLLRLVRSTPKSSSFRPLSEAIPQLWTPQHRQYSSTCYRSHPKHDSNTKNVEKTNDKLSGNNLTVWFQKENRTLPNLITAMRIVASPGLTYAVMNDMKFWALGGCVVFGFSDWLDGYIAKNYNQMSRLGAFLDPLADKVMIGSLSIGLMYRDLLPGELVALILGRDLFLLSMAFIIRALEKPEGAAYFDTTSSATFEIIPSEISKVSGNIPVLFFVYWLTDLLTVDNVVAVLRSTQACSSCCCPPHWVSLRVESQAWQSSNQCGGLLQQPH